jgi:alpha-beta hydrolase superfamily lysophospholipase
MTDSYNLFPKKSHKLIIIHGLNNNPSAFFPLKDEFSRLGWEVSFLTLPCHGSDRKEARDFKSAFKCFDQSMKELTSTPYSVIAFSHGALYLQLWLEKNPKERPNAQVLLAPALFIHRLEQIERTMSLLPSFFLIKSFAPKAFRRYQTLSVREYRILLEGIRTFQKHRAGLNVASLIMIDPKDELVDAQALQDCTALKEKVVFEKWPREYLKKGIGRHHILFHPDYFEKTEWQKFTDRIQKFLTAHL